jgi:hypothetical protein
MRLQGWSWASLGAMDVDAAEATGNGSEDGTGTDFAPDHDSPVLMGAAYGMLLLLGLLLGVVGGFGHAWYFGEFPVGSLAWLVVLFAVPYGMGRLGGGRASALLPAIGWVIVSFFLAIRQPGGDLVIAGTTAGFWYLYGGMVVVIAAVLLTRSSGSWLLASHGRAR